MIMSALLLTGSIAVPAGAQTTVDQGTTTDHDNNFNWGLLGLLGLAGLIGRKRDRDVARTTARA
jgi:hypothetical protein